MSLGGGRNVPVEKFLQAGVVAGRGDAGLDVGPFEEHLEGDALVEVVVELVVGGRRHRTGCLVEVAPGLEGDEILQEFGAGMGAGGFWDVIP